MAKRRYSKVVKFQWPKRLRGLNTVLLTDPSQLEVGMTLIDTTGNKRRILSLTNTHAWMSHKNIGGVGKEHPIEHLIKWGNKILIE